MPRPKRTEKYPATLFLATASALLGSFQLGYQIAVLNTSQNFIAKELSYNNKALLSSAVVLGAGIGALFAGRLADAIGPKKAQLLNALPFTAGALLCALTPLKYVPFIIGRVLCGLGSGAASVIAPRYIAEISPPRMRGKLGSQHQVREYALVIDVISVLMFARTPVAHTSRTALLRSSSFYGSATRQRLLRKCSPA